MPLSVRLQDGAVQGGLLHLCVSGTCQMMLNPVGHCLMACEGACRTFSGMQQNLPVGFALQ